MNKILGGLLVVLTLAVVFLFYKIYSPMQTVEQTTEKVMTAAEDVKDSKRVMPVATEPTGKIAFIDIDRLNEESLEITDLIAESKRRKNNIEASVESLSMEYQKKVEEFQVSQKAGIAPQSEMENKAREIQRIEQEAQNKQLMMDNLSMEINDKNLAFQKNVKDFLIRWNQGRYDFILSYSEAVPSMLLGNSTLEVTNEIITELNKQYKEKKKKK
jgi:outer membrane protein